MLITLALLVACSANKQSEEGLKSSEPKSVRELLDPQSTRGSLDEFYKIKGYRPVNIFELEYWEQQNFHLAYIAWQRSCKSQKIPIEIFIKCKTQKSIDDGNAKTIKLFFEQNFRTYMLPADSGLLTAYYEPVLLGSRKRTKEYNSPIFKKPTELVSVGTLNEEAKTINSGLSKKRKSRSKVTPYYTRKEIVENNFLKGYELLFLKDPVENFFLHIQGSGTIELSDGKKIRVGYAGSNGRPYRSIAKWLDSKGLIPLHKASMGNIKKWVKKNPSRKNELFNYNPRFIFFQESPVSSDPTEGPIGTLGIPLTANHSIAVDERFIKLGTPVMVIEDFKDKKDVLRKTFFMMAQDTGNAIKGANRGDLFLGTGARAGIKAGSTKFRGKLIIFLPK